MHPILYVGLEAEVWSNGRILIMSLALSAIRESGVCDWPDQPSTFTKSLLLHAIVDCTFYGHWPIQDPSYTVPTSLSLIVEMMEA